MPILMYIQRIEVRLEQKLKNQLYSSPHSLCSRPRYALRVMTSTQFNNMAFGNDTSVYISTLYRAKANLKSYFFVYLEFGIFSTLSISDMQQNFLQKISSNSYLPKMLNGTMWPHCAVQHFRLTLSKILSSKSCCFPVLFERLSQVLYK